jgi:hypothetical protein
MNHTSPDATGRCPECGAALDQGVTCQEQLAEVLGWESLDRELFQLHFYTVACFNLQHPAQFTDDAIQQLRSTFVAAIDGTTPLETLRRQMGSKFETSSRVLKDPGDRHPVLREWDVTMADVYHDGRPEGASYRVRRWATSIRSRL